MAGIRVVAPKEKLERPEVANSRCKRQKSNTIELASESCFMEINQMRERQSNENQLNERSN
jgi:hypothetical protein